MDHNWKEVWSQTGGETGEHVGGLARFFMYRPNGPLDSSISSIASLDHGHPISL